MCVHCAVLKSEVSVDVCSLYCAQEWCTHSHVFAVMCGQGDVLVFLCSLYLYAVLYKVARRRLQSVHKSISPVWAVWPWCNIYLQVLHSCFCACQLLLCFSLTSFSSIFCCLPLRFKALIKQGLITGACLSMRNPHSAVEWEDSFGSWLWFVLASPILLP